MIVVAGESLIDFVHRPNLAADGGNGPVYEACPGGSPYNCAIALGRLQIEVGFLCPLSDDSLGTLLRTRLEDSGVTALMSEPVQAPTSLAVVSLDEEGSPSYSFYRQDTADRQLEPAAVTAALPDRVEAFQIGSLALIEKEDTLSWATALDAAIARGAVVSLDPNVRMRLISDDTDYRARLMAMLHLADIIKASDEDLDYFYPGLAPEEAIRQAMTEHAISLAILTRGKEGATAYTASGLSASRPAKSFTGDDEEKGDSIGAGDSFQAGLLAWLKDKGLLTKSGLAALTEENLGEMLEFAGSVAGLNCAETGCNPPTREKLQETLDSAES